MLIAIKLLAYISVIQLVAFLSFRRTVARPLRSSLQVSDLLLILMIPVVGLLSGSQVVFYAFMAGLPLTWAGRPEVLVSRYLLCILLFPELGQSVVAFGVYFGQFSAIHAFNCGALASLALTRLGRSPKNAMIDTIAWVFFLCLLVMASRGLELGGTARSTAATFLAIVPPYYIIARLVRTPEVAVKASIFFVLGAFNNALIALFETARRWPLYQGFYDSLHVPLPLLSATLSVRGGLLRAQGAVGSPASLGLLLAFGLVLVIVLRQKFRPLGYRTVVLVLALGNFVTLSRGAWISAFVGLLMFFALAKNARAFGSLAAFLFIGVVAGSLVAPSSRIGSLVGRSGHAEQTASFRSSLLVRGLDEVARHPFHGQTRAELESSMSDLRGGDGILDFVNTHLYAALVGGLIGFAVWLLAWILPVFIGWRRSQSRSPGTRMFIAAAVAMLVASFACLTFTSAIERMPTLVMVAMGLLAAVCQKQFDYAHQVSPNVARRRKPLVYGLRIEAGQSLPHA